MITVNIPVTAIIIETTGISLVLVGCRAIRGNPKVPIIGWK
ncbi:MAG: hypothetical protein ACP5C3_00585 [Methanomicrobiales archaeon]